MIKAIVYTSNTGFTKKYAEMLAERLSLSAYTLDEAKGKLGKSDAVAYLGWLMAGGVKGLKKAEKSFDLGVVCAVGMAPSSPDEHARLAKQNNLAPESFFLLQGGFDINKLSGIYRFMMNLMVKAMSKGLLKKVEENTATDAEKEMLEMALHGKDCTSFEALDPIVEFLQK